MAKKKKRTGNPFTDLINEVLSGLTPEQQMNLVDGLDAIMRSGKSM